MKWTHEKIENEIYKFMKELGIDRMPTHEEMRKNGYTGLGRAITLNGKTDFWVKKLGLKTKDRPRKWTKKLIESEIHKVKETLLIERMPTTSELMDLGRNDLHCAISKNGGYQQWSKKLGICQKESETQKGRKYEQKAKRILERKGMEINDMTNGHPFDLLVNGNVKIDVKMGMAHNHYNSRCHTFRPSSKYSTCDLYICFALNELKETEKIFVIPSKFAKVETLNICRNSKYNKFIDRWDLIEMYAEFYDSVTV